MKVKKDKIFHEKKLAALPTIGFLKALRDHTDKKEAFRIAEKAAANFMIAHYGNILRDTDAGTQERFDVFRRYYEKYPEISPYCEILESTPTKLRVVYNRCPWAEILYEENLFLFAPAYCASDRAFTEKLLPGVSYSRNENIVKGHNSCHHVWCFDGYIKTSKKTFCKKENKK
jgi:hypothetical protein